MYALLITFIALVLLRLLVERKYRPRKIQSIGTALRDEVSAWLLTVAALVGIIVLFYALALLLGPIPQIHEW